VNGAADRLLLQARKRLGAFELQCDVDLPLAGLTALFGPSGSGKTTLINLVAGLHRPDQGRIVVGADVFFDGARGIDVPVERRALGVVFQDARLFPHLSVRNNLMFGFRRAGTRAHSPRVTFDAIVQLLGIGALLERRPHTLSGGERQRVAIGRALLAQPRLLLMDEPLASLDAARKAEVLPYIESLRDQYDVPILYVSHALDEVLRLATAMVVLEQGRAVAAGPVTDVLARADVRERLNMTELGTLVFGAVRAHDDAYALSTLDCAGFELHVPRVDLPLGTRLRVRIPSRDVALALARPSDVSISNRIEGVIESVVPQAGPFADVMVRVSSGTAIAARITRESMDRLALTQGLPVWCLIKSVALDAGALVLARGAAATRAAGAANDARLNDSHVPPRR
jgi:molybdate transport system ATP-binding protein